MEFQMEAPPLLPLDEAVSGLRDTSEATAFLQAVLSKAEYARLDGRWKAFQLKRAGLPHRQAAKLAQVSGATVTRSAALVGTPILEEIIRRGDLGEQRG
jgi:uncharacterized protein YerC